MLNKIGAIRNGWLEGVEHQHSPHFTPREQGTQINLLVVHNISLPPAIFEHNYVTDFFLGKLDITADPYFEEIVELKVSAHCFIRRNGDVIQYVSFDDKAWHAGISSYQGREKCNDFSIGIELEGTDTLAYTELQYRQLAALTQQIQSNYPFILDNIAGHNDIAPGRKTDPGEAFSWERFKKSLKNG